MHTRCGRCSANGRSSPTSRSVRPRHRAARRSSRVCPPTPPAIAVTSRRPSVPRHRDVAGRVIQRPARRRSHRVISGRPGDSDSERLRGRRDGHVDTPFRSLSPHSGIGCNRVDRFSRQVGDLPKAVSSRPSGDTSGDRWQCGSRISRSSATPAAAFRRGRPLTNGRTWPGERGVDRCAPKCAVPSIDDARQPRPASAMNLLRRLRPCGSRASGRSGQRRRHRVYASARRVARASDVRTSDYRPRRRCFCLTRSNRTATASGGMCVRLNARRACGAIRKGMGVHLVDQRGISTRSRSDAVPFAWLTTPSGAFDRARHRVVQRGRDRESDDPIVLRTAQPDASRATCWTGRDFCGVSAQRCVIMRATCRCGMRGVATPPCLWFRRRPGRERLGSIRDAGASCGLRAGSCPDDDRPSGQRENTARHRPLPAAA